MPIRRRAAMVGLGLLFLLGAWTECAWPWGDLGRTVVGEIAFQELSYKARKEVIRLIEKDPSSRSSLGSASGQLIHGSGPTSTPANREDTHANAAGFLEARPLSRASVQEWGAARGEIRSPIARSPGPSILAPVFHGFKDYASPSVRVYFPSLDGSPHNAALLVKCERFPLVMFVHGDCGGDLFQQWISLPAQLARSGYVVAVAKSFRGRQMAIRQRRRRSVPCTTSCGTRGSFASA
jgi:hypothetical protein